ncbi:nuclear transport factor 2 family protein [Myxococcus sp. CA051A]|uniref:Nuclear transport factor 2 family protein n=1 Tax=Myxococcus llanfairpwllgwyngyllgogerychwyrndrobwllllantysiliogogogochensis TaxID=2590453 RepID=A0A540WRI1_9BACT|nr:MULTISPECIES: nuclear transport factor 2 family protein [Myxococcus]NTX08857.1 nuclear transport factor 2 family protein [Myxococcus sp. CA040A]NTX17655.1 nuclear transport factor 2 family protein [Myxococcus sp. CA056]NTX40777.1 nuclear transport factor 2 family protein [Myxococcus sp. CA033]NTX63473.1 nuclear transport factor 2 family protein [Myxococcus sp. CA051A]TQF11610.1 nuclear transport factor 2 family protein [Myxococcus llanfairpwllgwyngyllgogerychwyrndrobwllllantysiliogogogochen
MATERAERFVEALSRLEESGDLEGLIELFSDDARVSNVASSRVFSGKEGARQFWREYKGTLRQVKSTFRNMIEAGDRVALEWESQGTAHNGAAVAYEGVSILEWDGEHIRRFYAYYDPHALGTELAHGTARRSEVPATTPA